MNKFSLFIRNGGGRLLIIIFITSFFASLAFNYFKGKDKNFLQLLVFIVLPVILVSGAYFYFQKRTQRRKDNEF